MKTRPIGERFEIDGQEYEVVEMSGCVECDFDRCCTDDQKGECSALTRTDGRSVIFVRVEK